MVTRRRFQDETSGCCRTICGDEICCNEIIRASRNLSQANAMGTTCQCTFLAAADPVAGTAGDGWSLKAVMEGVTCRDVQVEAR
jgi:hypothetical protein